MMSDFSKLLLNKEATILDAIKIIDEGGIQITLVIDDSQKLLGTVTDGDIRRALLKGNQMNDKVTSCLNLNFISAKNDISLEEKYKILKSNDIRQLPLLNNLGQVVDIFTSEELYKTSRLDNYVVIMAGGLGKRLGSLTRNSPKPMINVGGKPILEIILEHCIENGFCNFYLSVNYLKEKIIDYFGDGSKWGVRIKYLEETKPLGTAGSLYLLPKDLKSSFLILNGDVLTKCNLRRLIKIHNEGSSNATVVSKEYPTTVPYGVISSEGIKVKEFVEKPTYFHHINAGIYVIDQEIINLLSGNSYIDMPSLLQFAIANNLEVNLHSLHNYWLDIGHPETLEKAKDDWGSSI